MATLLDRKSMLCSFMLSYLLKTIPIVAHFSEISQFLAQQLLTVNESEREKWLATIINHIQNQSLTSSVIEKPNIELAIRVSRRDRLIKLQI